MYVWTEENTNCRYEATWLNKIFFFYVLVPEALIRLSCILFWNSFRYLRQRKLIINIAFPIFYAGWFILTMCYYDDFTPACYEPYPSYSLFIFTIELLTVLPQAFLVICLVSFLIVFSPCIIYTCCKFFMDERERTRVKR